MCFELLQRALRKLQELDVGARAVASIFLRDVGGNRNGGAAKLWGHGKSFASKKRSREEVGRFGEVHPLPPNTKIAVRLDRAPAHLQVSRLPTADCPLPYPRAFSSPGST